MTKIIFEDIKINKINQKKSFPIKDDIVKNDLNINKFNSNKNINLPIRFKKRIQATPQFKNKPKIIRKSIFIIFLIVLFFSAILKLGDIRHMVNIELIPKEQLIDFKNQDFVASKDENNNIKFEIMIISDKKFKKIILTESKEVSVKATGNIVLYNEYSSNPQNLLAGTFISDEQGKNYQIDKTITIPGYSIVENKIVPGQIKVDITSFLPGEAYNGSPLDFKIVSFKGTDKYNKIYGKSEEGLNGGASGFYYILNSSDKVNINEIANSSIKEDLLNQVKVLFPDDYILYPNLINFSYNIDDKFISKNSESEIEIEGILSVVLFKKESLINNLIKTSLPNIPQKEINNINIFNLERLSFYFADKNQIISKETEKIYLKLKGDINLVWSPDIENLKMKLLNIHKDEVLPILKQDKTIAQASIKIFPPWYKYLPSDLSKINIILNK